MGPTQDLRLALIAVAASGALRVAFRRWVEDDGRGDLRDLIAGAVTSLRVTVCGAPAEVAART